MKPEFAIEQEYINDGFTVLSINTSEAKYQGHSWKGLSEVGKRKFQNLLIMARPKERLKFI